MQKLQNEYSSILASSKDQNAFCRTFVEMTELEESKDNLQASVRYYDELKDDNSIKLKTLLDDKLAEVIKSSENLYVHIIVFKEHKSNDVYRLIFKYLNNTFL